MKINQKDLTKIKHIRKRSSMGSRNKNGLKLLGTSEIDSVRQNVEKTIIEIVTKTIRVCLPVRES